MASANASASASTSASAVKTRPARPEAHTDVFESTVMFLRWSSVTVKQRSARTTGERHLRNPPGPRSVQEEEEVYLWGRGNQWRNKISSPF